MLPRARKTNQLPAELYADNLKRFGVQMDPHELMARALASYQQTRSEMEPLARRIAEERKWTKTDYRDVIRELKKQRIPDDQLLALYTGRLEQIEAIIRRENLVTLPTRKAVIRLATPAESAATPAPHIDPPRLDRQHRRAGGVRAADEQSERRAGRRHGRLQLRRDRLDADGARGATGSRAAVRAACWSAACRRRASCSL